MDRLSSGSNGCAEFVSVGQLSMAVQGALVAAIPLELFLRENVGKEIGLPPVGVGAVVAHNHVPFPEVRALGGRFGVWLR